MPNRIWLVKTMVQRARVERDAAPKDALCFPESTGRSVRLSAGRRRRPKQDQERPLSVHQHGQSGTGFLPVSKMSNFSCSTRKTI